MQQVKRSVSVGVDDDVVLITLQRFVAFQHEEPASKPVNPPLIVPAGVRYSSSPLIRESREQRDEGDDRLRETQSLASCLSFSFSLPLSLAQEASVDVNSRVLTTTRSLVNRAQIERLPRSADAA